MPKDNCKCVRLQNVHIHCKEPIPKIRNKFSQKRNKYSQKWNCAATVSISKFLCLLAIYIFPPSISLFYSRKYVDRSWEYINRSQTHECGNWDWGRAIPRKGIHKWHFLCSVVYLCLQTAVNLSACIMSTVSFSLGHLTIADPADSCECFRLYKIYRQLQLRPFNESRLSRLLWMYWVYKRQKK
jgi:hypothetical protein